METTTITKQTAISSRVATRIHAARYAIAQGLQIKEQCPQVADDYRAVEFIGDIVRKRNILTMFGFRREPTAIISTRYALHGNTSDLGPKYEGLLHPDERLPLRKAHLAGAARKHNRLAGYVGWDDAEKIYVLALAQLPRYQHVTQRGQIQTVNSAIARTVNRDFHGGDSVRNETMVRSILVRYALTDFVMGLPRFARGSQTPHA